MAGLSTGLTGILRLQWVAYWRRIFRNGSAGKNNLVVLGLFTLMAAARYFTVLKGVVTDARKSQWASLDLLAAGALAVCLAPLWDEGLKNIGPRDLSRFPLSAGARWVSRVWGRLIAPLSWIAVLFCLTLFAPLLAAAHPVCGVFSGIALLWMAWMAGMGASHLLSTARGRAAIFLFVAAISAGAAFLWFRLGTRSVVALSWLPSHLVVLGASGNWVACAALALLALAASYLAFASLIWMLETAPVSASRKTVSSSSITLLRKELRYFARLESPVWLVLAAFAFYLATAEAPEPDALRAVLLFTSVFTASAPVNFFGQDGVGGLDRYGLWPLSGWRIVAGKNRAFALLACARWLPILALGCWRFGWLEAVYGLVEAASLALGTMAWGNVTSLRHPSSGDDSGITLLDSLIGLAASGLPGALAIGILRGPPAAAPAAMSGMLAACALLYVVSVRWAVAYYTRRFDTIREWLA